MALAQVDTPVDTIVITEDWSQDATGAAINAETWLEAFNGDMARDPLRPGSMLRSANRHQGGMNCAFFDRQWLKPDTIWQSRDLTGCRLVHNYPTPKMCDKWNPGCTSLDAKNNCNDERFNPANY